MHVRGRPVASFDPHGLIFGAGIDAELIKLYDVRSFDRVNRLSSGNVFDSNFFDGFRQSTDQRPFITQNLTFRAPSRLLRCRVSGEPN